MRVVSEVGLLPVDWALAAQPRVNIPIVRNKLFRFMVLLLCGSKTGGPGGSFNGREGCIPVKMRCLPNMGKR